MANDRFVSYKDMRPISIKVDPQLYTKCKIYCLDRDLTMQKFFQTLLDDFFSGINLQKITKKLR